MEAFGLSKTVLDLNRALQDLEHFRNLKKVFQSHVKLGNYFSEPFNM